MRELPVIFARPLARTEKVYHFVRPHGDERLEQDAVDEREDGGIHPNGEGEGENGDGSESRRFDQLPKGKFEILDHGFLMRCGSSRVWIQKYVV